MKLFDEYHPLPEVKQCDYHKKGHSTSRKGISKIQKMKQKVQSPRRRRRRRKKKGPRTINLKVRKYEPKKVLNLGKNNKKILRYPNS
jgi:hypothetical protein